MKMGSETRGMAKQKLSNETGKAKEKWRSFRPVGYKLSNLVWELPIKRLEKNTSGEGEPVTWTPTTVGDAFKQFNGWLREEGEEYVEVEGEPIREINYSFDDALAIETDSGKEIFSGTQFAARLLCTLVWLRKDGINPYTVRWFFYDEAFSRDASQSFAFFLVCDDKIAKERILIYRDPGDSSFDPAVLHDPWEGIGPPIWDEDSWQEADTAFWYRKFYTETKTGQLMLLRPDEPILYYYQRPEARDVVSDLQLVTLAKIYRLLLVAVALLGAIAFPSFREYLGIAAAAFGVDYFLVCWRTRKVGRPR